MIKKLLGLVVVAGAVFGLVWFAPHFSLTVGDVPQASSLRVKAQDLTLVCAGGAYQPGGTNGTSVGDFNSVGSPTVSSTFDGPASTSLISKGDQLTVADPAGVATQNSMLLNANQVQSVSAGSMAGVTATACQRPASSLWLIGGDTTTGSESLLILKNPTKVDSTVSLELYSSSGKVTGSGLSGISVAAGKSTIVPLAGFLPKTQSFATHVISRGGLISAWVQQVTIRGLASGGVDYVSPAAPFATTQVIPGLFIRGSADAGKLEAASPDYADLVPTLRVFVPGDKSATVTAQILGATAKTFGTVVRQTVPAGSTADIALPGLADGDYVAVVTSDVAIGASARINRVAAKKVDFAWLSSAAPQSSSVAFTAPNAGISELGVANPSNAAITVEVSQANSDSKFKIAAQGQLTLKFAPGAKVKLTPSGRAIYGNLLVDVSGGIGAFGLLDYQNAGGQVAVMVR